MTTATSDLKVLQEFASSPDGLALLQRRREVEKAERVALVRDLARLNAEEATAVAKTTKAMAAASADVVAAENRLNAAREEHQKAYAEDVHVRGRFNTEKTILETRLTRMADPAITEFKRDLQAELDMARKQLRSQQFINRHRLTGAVRLITETNARAIQQRCDAINDALRASQGLHAEPIGHDETLQRIESLRKSLPPANYQTEDFGERWS